MGRANTIARCEAKLASGEEIVYSDWEPDHIRGARFQRIIEGQPMTFTAVTLDDTRFTVDLVSGTLAVGNEIFVPQIPAFTPLRLIYYKRMGAGVSDLIPTCDFFVVGWQATLDGKNVKVGLKVNPNTQTWEVTEDI